MPTAAAMMQEPNDPASNPDKPVMQLWIKPASSNNAAPIRGNLTTQFRRKQITSTELDSATATTATKLLESLNATVSSVALRNQPLRVHDRQECPGQSFEIMWEKQTK